MNAILLGAVAFAMSQIALSSLLFMRMRRSMSLQEWLFLAFLVTVAAYLIQPWTATISWLNPIQRVVENFLPGVFWLLCSSLFNDRFKIKPWMLLIVATTVIMPLILVVFSWQSALLATIVFKHLPQTIELVLLALALFEVVRHWNDDLIESRRDLRLWFCAMTGLYIFAMVMLREVIIPNSEWFAVWQYLPVGLICLFTNLLLVQYRPGLLNIADVVTVSAPEESTATIEVAEPEPEVEVPSEVVAKLNQLMNEEFIYRKMGLTIGQLASELDLPEYRLRRIINAGLGFRNFNDYLNGFRIKEAGERLADPEQLQEAVLNIALDTGFRSLSSFNKAFREAYGVTPTVYRQQQNHD